MSVEETAVVTGLGAAFTEAMSRLVSGVAVVGAQGPDGKPCGMLVTSLCSYSVRPPSILMAVAHGSRTAAALSMTGEFSVHLLSSAGGPAAEAFAGQGQDKFHGLDWTWDGAVPRLADVPVYLRCSVGRMFGHGDHSVVIGEVADCRLGPGEPLVYFGRRLDWSLMDGPDAW
ncbi:MAG TPA: flavin reductase family protein [Actinospica sp.]|nr:flavin reductase family protein [Actinospica sp.]